jgi:hypothetical protein
MSIIHLSPREELAVRDIQPSDFEEGRRLAQLAEVCFRRMQGMGICFASIIEMAVEVLAQEIGDERHLGYFLDRFRAVPQGSEHFPFTQIGSEPSYFTNDMNVMLKHVKDTGVVPKSFSLASLRQVLDHVPMYQIPRAGVHLTWLPHVAEQATRMRRPARQPGAGSAAPKR